MSIRHAILGLLSWKPATGYDLKKSIEDSSSMYWSGNNNQIYRTLVQLQADGLVGCETVHRDGAPSRKVYSIATEGRSELDRWLRSPPELPECRKTFLVRLAWADALGGRELHDLLAAYATELEMHLLLQEERMRRGIPSPDRTPREKVLWEMIEENAVRSYRMEIEWVEEVRRRLSGTEEAETGTETPEMEHRVGRMEGVDFVEVLRASTPVATDQGAVDLVALGWAAGTRRLLVHSGVLSPVFVDLSTGVAGKVLQKFVNYEARVAVVATPGTVGTAKFREMAAEADRRGHYRIFADRETALDWLVRL